MKLIVDLGKNDAPQLPMGLIRRLSWEWPGTLVTGYFTLYNAISHGSSHLSILIKEPEIFHDWLKILADDSMGDNNLVQVCRQDIRK